MLRQLYGDDLDRMSARYPQIQCPTLVLHGERDWLIHLPHAERLAREIPKAELVRVPRCGHFPGEEAPAFVARELRRFSVSRVTLNRSTPRIPQTSPAARASRKASPRTGPRP